MTKIITKPKGTKGVLSFYGGCEEFLRSKDHQVFLYGGTGAGKTVAVCEKLFLLHLLYPGSKSLVTRNSYVALVKSALATFEKVVRLSGWDIGKKNGGPKVIYRIGESKPTEYRFPYAKRVMEDGTVFEGESRMLISSLSNAKDELGAEYDYIYLNQPELSSEDDWQFLVTRATGRCATAPYPLLFGDPNPESESHWIKKGGYYIDSDGTLTTANGEIYKADEYTINLQDNTFYNLEGKEIKGVRWRMIKSIYTDNPSIWNHKLECFTPDGEKMMANLTRSLSPVMVERLINGEWCSYEGLVFADAWDRQQHVRPRAEFNITDDWKRYWCFDFGFEDPFTFHIFAKNPEKEQYVCTKYICKSHKTINEHAEQIKNITIGEPRPSLIVADRNPESISILEQELGMNIISAKKGSGSIKAGINVLIDMLKNKELIFLEDALVEEDMFLRNKKEPIGFPEEVESYRWDINKTEEIPIGGQDHCIDPIRYLFTHIKANNRTIPFIWK